MTLFKWKRTVNDISNFYWNYRIKEKTYTMDKESQIKYNESMKKVFGDDYELELEPEIYYEIVEVYYGENDEIIAWSDLSISPWRKL